jgi:hypothetical protein
MLSEKILEQLVRSAPLRDHIIAAAWPSMSVESKLQIIEALADATGSIHDFAVDLALGDDAPIVRYWAASRFTFSSRKPKDYVEGFGSIAPSVEDYARYAKAHTDPCDLVRARANVSDKVTLKNLENFTRFERLVFLRTTSDADLDDFAEFLNRAIDSKKVSDQELAEAVREYLSSTAMKDETNLKIHPDPYGELCRERGLAALWQVTHKAERALRNTLSFWLPLRIGETRLTQQQILSLPSDVIANLLYHEDEEAVAAIEEIRKNPDKYPKSLVEEIAKRDEFESETLNADDEFDIKERKLRQMTDRTEAIFQAISELRRELATLREQVNETIARRRGLFSW